VPPRFWRCDAGIYSRVASFFALTATALQVGRRRLFALSVRARDAIRARWRGFDDRQRRFVVNIAIGIAISVLLLPVETNALVERLREVLLTWQSGHLQSDPAPELAWIDIDDTAYLAWNAPDVTPRDKLCRLIDFAIRGASVVVVDMDLSARPGYQPLPAATVCDSTARRDVKGDGDADRVLVRYVDRYARDCRLKGRSAAGPCPLLLLIRTPRTSPSLFFSKGRRAREPRSSVLDTVHSSPYVMWSIPNFEEDDDRIVRRWRLWEPLCDGIVGDALPSTELLAVSAYKWNQRLPKKHVDSPADVRAKLASLRPICRRSSSDGPVLRSESHPVTVNLGFPVTLTQNTAEHFAERRFFYRFGWSHRTEDEQSQTENPQTVGRLVRAADITEKPSVERPDPRDLNGRIAVIGTSYDDSTDFYRTPLGRMPGSLVLLNAINALYNDDHFRESPWWARLLSEAALVALSAWLTYMWPAHAMRIAPAIVLFGFLFVGATVLNNGYWFDPVMPLLGIQVHELMAQFEARRHQAERTTS
jgi:hypothetical protein